MLGLIGGTFSAAPPASAYGAAVTINVGCRSGQAVQGLWFKSDRGEQNWARWVKPMGSGQQFSFGLSQAPSDRVDLSIGCGGSQQNWRTTNYYSIAVYRDRMTFNLLCNDNTDRRCPIS